MLASDLKKCLKCGHDLPVLAFKLLVDGNLSDVCKRCKVKSAGAVPQNIQRVRKNAQWFEVDTERISEHISKTANDGSRVCIDCNERKPKSNFRQLGLRPSSYCIPCHDKKVKEWHRNRRTSTRGNKPRGPRLPGNK